MKRTVTALCLLLGVGCLLWSCSRGCSPQDVRVVTVMTHDSFSMSEEVLAAFEKEQGIRVKFLKSGDAGAALNLAVLSRDHPLADIFYGVDNTFISRALDADIFIPYRSPLLASICPELVLDKTHRLLPVDYGDVCLNYDRAWFENRGVPVPRGLQDLVRPEYSGLLVVENPATSSPGLAFLLATVAHFGEDGFVRYWKDLSRNDVLVVDGWEDAYWGRFSAASKGDRPLVVSYSTSPAVEVHYAERPVEQAPTGAIVEGGSAFRQIEFVGILKGTRSLELSQKVVDFLLDKQFQEGIPLQMFMFPAHSRAELPEVFARHARLAEDPTDIRPEVISEHREKWIRAWTQAVLR
jgi:thiamine transport system substrate-binding protein